MRSKNNPPLSSTHDEVYWIPLRNPSDNQTFILIRFNTHVKRTVIIRWERSPTSRLCCWSHWNSHWIKSEWAVDNFCDIIVDNAWNSLTFPRLCRRCSKYNNRSTCFILISVVVLFIDHFITATKPTSTWQELNLLFYCDHRRCLPFRRNFNAKTLKRLERKKESFVFIFYFFCFFDHSAQLMEQRQLIKKNLMLGESRGFLQLIRNLKKIQWESSKTNSKMGNFQKNQINFNTQLSRIFCRSS